MTLPTGYPGPNEIASAAQRIGVSTRTMYAFAATYGFVPSSTSDPHWEQFTANTSYGSYYDQLVAPLVGGNLETARQVLYAYMTAEGAYPATTETLLPWLVSAGVITSDHSSLTGTIPPIGWNYAGYTATAVPLISTQTPAAQTTTAQQSTTPTSSTSSTSTNPIADLGTTIGSGVSTIETDIGNIWHQYEVPILIGGGLYLAWRTGILHALFGGRRR